MDLGHWETDLLYESNNKPYGFIYEIICTANGKRYIGKKQCKTLLKRKPLKGKKNKRIEEKETDWRTYTSSSRELNEDIINLGKDKFKFKIILWCYSKFDLAYNEAKIQFEREVLLKDEYYNGIINLRVGRPKKRNL
jgi:hypothetical protein